MQLHFEDHIFILFMRLSLHLIRELNDGLELRVDLFFLD